MKKSPPGTGRDELAAFIAADSCALCGESEEDCACPSCEACGATGNPLCYERHGMRVSIAQAIARTTTDLVDMKDALDGELLFVDTSMVDREHAAVRRSLELVRREIRHAEAKIARLTLAANNGKRYLDEVPSLSRL